MITENERDKEIYFEMLIYPPPQKKMNKKEKKIN